MKGLDSLLNRISNILNKEELRKKSILDVIREKTKITLNPEQIFLKNGVLEIEASPVAKNEIKLKEDFLKQELKISRILYK